MRPANNVPHPLSPPSAASHISTEIDDCIGQKSHPMKSEESCEAGFQCTGGGGVIKVSVDLGDSGFSLSLLLRKVRVDVPARDALRLAW